MSVVARAARQAGFSPNKVPGLAMWLKADAITGLGDGAAVSSWADSSGAGNTATQGTGGLQPTYKTGILNGLPVVRFDGTADVLVAHSAASVFTGSDMPFTISLVVQQASVVAAQVFFSAGRSSSFTPFTYVGMNATPKYVGSKRDDANSAVTPPGGTPTTAPHVLTYLTTGTLLSIWDAGAIVVTANNFNVGTTTLDQVGVGAFYRSSAGSTWLNGDLAEVILFNRVLADAERKQVERYLGRKYAITVA